ncbi:MAG: hypothetical protein E7161_05230 [Firmicutes bacterium]|nr:hypothetical protein [Bacillota bacterium]
MKNNWNLKVFFLTFILAMIFSLIANVLGKFNNTILIVCIISIILIGIVFDIVGTAVLSCDTKVLHSRASQKLKGAKQAINLAKNASSVSSFCNDVVGDVCGIVSGSLVTILVVNLFINSNLSIWNVILSSVLSALTVGGKALGKSIGVKKSNDIIYRVGKILSIFSKKK